MKVITIKITIFSILFFSLTAQSEIMDSLDKFFVKEAAKEGVMAPPTHQRIVHPKVIKNIKIEKDKNGNYPIKWNVLREYNLRSKKQGKNLKKIINKNIVIEGFMIPLDYDAKQVREFLLVPYIPSCAHVPTPQPNMIINAKVAKKVKVKPSYGVVQVTGKLTILKSKKTKNTGFFMPDGIYSLQTTHIKEVEQQ